MKRTYPLGSRWIEFETSRVWTVLNAMPNDQYHMTSPDRADVFSAPYLDAEFGPEPPVAIRAVLRHATEPMRHWTVEAIDHDDHALVAHAEIDGLDVQTRVRWTDVGRTWTVVP